MPTPTVIVKLLPTFAGPDATAPFQQAQPGDAGMDLYAAEDVILVPGERALVPTGVVVALEDGVQLEIRPKSGLAAKQGLGLPNSPGTVDSGYRGEIKVIVHNTNPPVTGQTVAALLDTLQNGGDVAEVRLFFEMAHEANTIRIARGQKIAQAVFTRYEVPVFRVIGESEELPESVRGAGGFGSTGH